MNKYNRPRGTQDLYGNNLNKIKFLEKTIVSTAEKFGYQEIRTPIFENCETFTRAIGETSDIVKKEFFNFLDKGGREIALRPENTAGVIRAVAENKLLYNGTLPLKYYYYGSMFRYERPQSGRLREFEQFGIEVIATDSIYYDVEVILLCENILKNINITEYELLINNLGSFESRIKWINELKVYFDKYKDQLTELSIERLEKNPTRILDDKIDGQKDFVKKAPKIENFLSQEEIDKQKQIYSLLDKMGIKYKIDDTLVRGLDYYTNMIFEFVSTSEKLTGQNTIIGGGRYAKMLGEFGEEDFSCIGFGLGINRIALLLDNMNLDGNETIIFSILDNSLTSYYLPLITKLRDNGYTCICLYDEDKIKKSFGLAEEKNAKYVFIVGEKEKQQRTITIKNQETKTQQEISENDILSFLKNEKK